MTNRSPSDTDFFVELPQVGRFRYGRRTFGDRIRIRAEYLRLTGGFGDGDLDLSVMGAVVAQHQVLCVSAPTGWTDLEALDMSIDPDRLDAHLMALYGLVKEREDSFRRQPAEGGQATGARHGADDGAVVPPPVQARAAGSPLPGHDARGRGG